MQISKAESEGRSVTLKSIFSHYILLSCHYILFSVIIFLQSHFSKFVHAIFWTGTIYLAGRRFAFSKFMCLFLSQGFFPVYNLSRPSLFIITFIISHCPRCSWVVGAEGVKSTGHMGHEIRVTAGGWSLGCPSEGPQTSLSSTGVDRGPALSAILLPYTPNLGMDDDSAIPVRTNQDMLCNQATQISVLKKNSSLLFVHSSCMSGRGLPRVLLHPYPQASGAVTIWNTDSYQERGEENSMGPYPSN